MLGTPKTRQARFGEPLRSSRMAKRYTQHAVTLSGGEAEVEPRRGDACVGVSLGAKE